MSCFAPPSPRPARRHSFLRLQSQRLKQERLEREKAAAAAATAAGTNAMGDNTPSGGGGGGAESSASASGDTLSAVLFAQATAALKSALGGDSPLLRFPYAFALDWFRCKRHRPAEASDAAGAPPGSSASPPPTPALAHSASPARTPVASPIPPRDIPTVAATATSPGDAAAPSASHSASASGTGSSGGGALAEDDERRLVDEIYEAFARTSQEAADGDATRDDESAWSAMMPHAAIASTATGTTATAAATAATNSVAPQAVPSPPLSMLSSSLFPAALPLLGQLSLHTSPAMGTAPLPPPPLVAQMVGVRHRWYDASEGGGSVGGGGDAGSKRAREGARDSREDAPDAREPGEDDELPPGAERKGGAQQASAGGEGDRDMEELLYSLLP